MLSQAGTSTFKSPPGRAPFDIEHLTRVPGPGEYLSEKHLSFTTEPRNA
jgi:hypothetical protein